MYMYSFMNLQNFIYYDLFIFIPNIYLSINIYIFQNLVDISVGVSKQDPLYSTKMTLIEKQGRGATSVRFPLQGERYPSELVDFLRLLLVETEDLGMQVSIVFYCIILYFVIIHCLLWYYK